MKASLLAALLLFGSALAGTRLDRAGIVARLDASVREVWLYAPKLSDHEQADALRRAVVERGVVVTLLLAPPNVQTVCDPGATRCRQSSSDRDSYAYSLALAGARLFEARVPGNPAGFVLLDRRTGLEGVGIGVFSAGGVTVAAELDSVRASALHRWFLETLGDRRRSRAVSQSEILARLAAQSRAR